MACSFGFMWECAVAATRLMTVRTAHGVANKMFASILSTVTLFAPFLSLLGAMLAFMLYRHVSGATDEEFFPIASSKPGAEPHGLEQAGGGAPPGAVWPPPLVAKPPVGQPAPPPLGRRSRPPSPPFRSILGTPLPGPAFGPGAPKPPYRPASRTAPLGRGGARPATSDAVI